MLSTRIVAGAAGAVLALGLTAAVVVDEDDNAPDLPETQPAMDSEAAPMSDPADADPQDEVGPGERQIELMLDGTTSRDAVERYNETARRVFEGG